MAITFAMRGTSLTPYRSLSFRDYETVAANNQAAALASLGHVSVLGGSAVDHRNIGLGVRPTVYPGMAAIPSGAAFTIMCRIVPTWTGNPSAGQSVFGWTAGGTFAASGCMAISITTGAKISIFAANRHRATAIDYTSTASASFVNGEAIEIWVSWDGTTTANAVKIYTCAHLGTPTLLNQTTASLAVASRNISLRGGIGLGYEPNFLGTSAFYTNECVIWDEVIDPTVSPYAGRTDFISTTSIEGYSYSDPGVANVRNATSYTYAGTSQTGTLVVPSLANTKIGVAGDGGTGTYDGSDRHTDPGQANVATGIQYKSNSTTNNRTGTLDSVSTITSNQTISGPTRSATLTAR